MGDISLMPIPFISKKYTAPIFTVIQEARKPNPLKPELRFSCIEIGIYHYLEIIYARCGAKI
jgi:hypothetical protein